LTFWGQFFSKIIGLWQLFETKQWETLVWTVAGQSCKEMAAYNLSYDVRYVWPIAQELDNLWTTVYSFNIVRPFDLGKKYLFPVI